MDYRDCFPRVPLLPGEPDRLLAELHEAQIALTIVEHYVSHCCAYSSIDEAPSSECRFHAAHEALYEARDIMIVSLKSYESRWRKYH
jgi:hypothetical protein